MSALTARDRFRQNIEDGGEQVVVEYFKRLARDDATTEDLRKAVELAAKVHGLQQPDKTDNLMQVSWVINGGNVTIGVQPAAPEAPAAAIDVQATELPTGSPDEPAPVTLTIPTVDNLLMDPL